MITTNFTYIILNLLMMFVFVKAGEQISKYPKNYWKYAWWCIIAFTFILGLRYGRGNDYMHYIDVYKHDLEHNQLLFTAFNHWLKQLGVGAHYIFLYYSFIYITCAMVFLKDFRRYAKWILPLFLIAFTIFSEYVIRQALGFSFIFIFLKVLTNRKKTVKEKIPLLLLYAILATSIHSANALSVIVFTLIYIGIKKPIPPKISIPLFIIASYFFMEFFNWNWLTPALSVLGDSSNQFSGYVENVDRWFSSDAMNESYVRNSIVKVFQTAGECSLLYLGYKVISYYNNKRFIFLFNVYVFGTILQQSFYTVELLRRMANTLYCFWPFTLTIILLHHKHLWRGDWKRKKLPLICLSFFIYEYLKYLFLRDNGMYEFIWDSQFF